MTGTEQNVKRVQRWLKQTSEPKYAIAKRAGLHRNTLKGANRPDWNPTAKTLQAIERLIPIDFNGACSPDDHTVSQTAQHRDGVTT